MVHHPTSSNINSVRELILNAFSFLENQYGYKANCTPRDDDSCIESFEVQYLNENKQRKVRISYVNDEINSEIKYIFSASITRLPYKGVEDFFSLNQYLSSNGKSFPTDIVGVFDITEAESILQKIANILNRHLSTILDGSKWLDHYYPRWD
jgi:hypothetical protein